MDKNLLTPKHRWAEGGVSGYPLTHPIVGQGDFFYRFKNFIPLVDQSQEKFAHVFALVAQWGVGKSRLAYELISQINGKSPGWYVRAESGSLTPGNLFEEVDRDKYLGFYIRYSQIYKEYQNIDNWFGYGFYQVLLPLARAEFDTSIQGQIAREAYERLLPLGFDENRLATILQLDQNHSDEALYEHPNLITNLCTAARDYLQQFGIEYFLIALDELETVAETATFGLESEDIKYLDGRAIKLLGKAIKEEDPRRKLPWLRYVALCSPAIGDELREIQSTARRFELVELSRNPFADVSDFVKTLEQEGKLNRSYPTGVVEAAYAMSGGNFGWFNVIMAYVDQVLNTWKNPNPPSLGELFSEVVKVSGRIRDYVLDHNAINELRLSDRAHIEAARELLYGQLPVPLTKWQPDQLQTLLSGQNEYNEPIALRYRRVEWDDLDCSEALRQAKFRRDRDKWFLTGVDDPFNLQQLLDNLSTYAVHENGGVRTSDGKRVLLIPLKQAEFVQLVGLLYPHPAAEDAARELWKKLVGPDLNNTDATHVGPSIAMLGRLNLRYRKQGQNSLIFRNPDQNTAHEKAMEQRKNQPADERAKEILTGIMRLLDRNWAYDASSAGLADGLVAISTASGSRAREKGGLVNCDDLKLHPDGRLILAWVRNEDELERLCNPGVSQQFNTHGRTPVLAFTSSHSLVDKFANPASPTLKDARSYLLLYQLSASEEFALHQVGLPTVDCKGFRLDNSGFNSAFSNRLNTLLRPLTDAIRQWRRDLDAMGRIAWPLRPGGPLKDTEKALLFNAWRYLILSKAAPHSLSDLDETSGLDVEDVVDVLKKLDLRPKPEGYTEDDRAMLFSSLDDSADAVFPPFLISILEHLLQSSSWTLNTAKREWFWGYTWKTAKPKEIFEDWMGLACDLQFAIETSAGTSRDSASFSLRTTSELRNLITEADNWLKNDYPKIVTEKMALVFGEDKVFDYFAPRGAAKVGSKTSNAEGRLNQARDYLSALETAGANHASSPNEDQLLESAKQRADLLDAVSYVYLDKDYKQITNDGNVRTLSFEDESVPLWKRVRRAEIFAEKTLRNKKRICARIDKLPEQMKKDVRDLNLNHFPVHLFTWCLEKIRDILNGALPEEGTPQGSTARRQVTEPGTLGQYLRDLQVDNATTRLSQLAREVGIDLDSEAEADLEAIDGQIITGFRNLKQSYERLYSQKATLNQRLQKLVGKLQNTSTDFPYPTDIPTLAKFQNRIELLEDTLEGIKEDGVDNLQRDDALNNPSKLGNFQPLMQSTQGLLTEPTRELQQLLGYAATLENAITGYLKSLLGNPDVISIEKGLNSLLQVQGKPSRKELDLPELEAAGSLQAAIEKIEERRGKWVQEGNRLLASSGITFERWRRIVEALNAERDPQLEPEEAEKLVNARLLVRTYRLGGTK
ncbi:hypothetical protein H6G00_22245 [Leptolyngbya sp. FACHB-541]|uniref:hypothetical protein n=1 Tax=Leptolyngbya sp. FACHB-541 TaxID=2692810 RepID=UPI0016851971|nr:hypothetical protein [Leptolyngbya sp. FACHB-541]MBD1999298.1 hypothetical protein [Leptolyngbya sp. FACHB-541]